MIPRWEFKVLKTVREHSKSEATHQKPRQEERKGGTEERHIWVRVNKRKKTFRRAIYVNAWPKKDPVCILPRQRDNLGRPARVVVAVSVVRVPPGGVGI